MLSFTLTFLHFYEFTIHRLAQRVDSPSLYYCTQVAGTTVRISEEPGLADKYGTGGTLWWDMTAKRGCLNGL